MPDQLAQLREKLQNKLKDPQLQEKLEAKLQELKGSAVPLASDAPASTSLLKQLLPMLIGRENEQRQPQNGYLYASQVRARPQRAPPTDLIRTLILETLMSPKKDQITKESGKNEQMMKSSGSLVKPSVAATETDPLKEMLPVIMLSMINHPQRPIMPRPWDRGAPQVLPRQDSGEMIKNIVILKLIMNKKSDSLSSILPLLLILQSKQQVQHTPRYGLQTPHYGRRQMDRSYGYDNSYQYDEYYGYDSYNYGYDSYYGYDQYAPPRQQESGMNTQQKSGMNSMVEAMLKEELLGGLLGKPQPNTQPKKVQSNTQPKDEPVSQVVEKKPPVQTFKDPVDDDKPTTRTASKPMWGSMP